MNVLQIRNVCTGDIPLYVVLSIYSIDCVQICNDSNANLRTSTSFVNVENPVALSGIDHYLACPFDTLALPASIL
jgi:hypothetical protein